MATILPTGETTFFDANGDPLAGGQVFFYIPGTTTPKDTYQNADQSILNANPVILDGAGRAIIFGSGSYRQVVNDFNGNLIWDQTTAEPATGKTSFGGTSTGTANAQTLTAGTFDGSDGSTITFTAGLTNTGAMTLAVGGSAPISVLKNGPTGPETLDAGDVTSGNIYSVAYSTTQAAFQLLTSIPPTITIATEAEAAAGTNNTNFMTPLRTLQAINESTQLVFNAATQAITAPQTDDSAHLATTSYVRTAAKYFDVARFYDVSSLTVAGSYATIAQVSINKIASFQLLKFSYTLFVASGSLASGSKVRLFNVTENRAVVEANVVVGTNSGFSFISFDNAAVGLGSVTYVVQSFTPTGSAGLVFRGLEATSYNS